MSRGGVGAGQRGARAHTGTAAPIPLGLPGVKWVWGCQSIYFSRDSGNLGVFVPCLFIMLATTQAFHSACGRAAVSAANWSHLG